MTSTAAVAAPDDALFLLPARYEDRTRVTPLGALLPGQRAVAEGEVQLAEVVFRRRRALLVRLNDGSGFLTLRFFYFSRAQREGFARGIRLRCFGEVRRGPLGLEMVHPEYRRVGEQPEALEQRLTPIYPLTEGETQGRVRQKVDRALQKLAATGVQELLPAAVLARLAMPPLAEALQFVHHPPVGVSLADLAAGRHPAQRRLAFEELLAHQLSLQLIKRRIQTEGAHPLVDAEGVGERLLRALPWPLTGAQRRVLGEVEADLQRTVPMVRLIQGDVGCGKTVVAAVAAARAVGSGGQAALMAPTELLAEQHWRSLEAWFRPLGIPVALLTGSQPARARRSARETVASGDVPVVVGTHALFQEGVTFARLDLVIVDEQHRFGVDQRLALRDKAGEGVMPHQLIMTATPIPRTLAMTAHADLDVSVIDELPAGRQPINTYLVEPDREQRWWHFVRERLNEGRQAFVVAPLVDESENVMAPSVTTAFERLTNGELEAFRVGLLHGRLTSAEKQDVMERFHRGEIQVLISTTVIEVGVDVPNASLMVIENAERMGLSQLHQLRGRVGRGSQESSCVLLYRGPLNEMARARLATIRDSNDGFEIANRDLQLRGPGELLGTRQTGLASLRVADLIRDADLLPTVREVAERLLDTRAPSIDALRARWIGTAEAYGRVG